MTTSEEPTEQLNDGPERTSQALRGRQADPDEAAAERVLTLPFLSGHLGERFLGMDRTERQYGQDGDCDRSGTETARGRILLGLAPGASASSTERGAAPVGLRMRPM